MSTYGDTALSSASDISPYIVGEMSTERGGSRRSRDDVPQPDRKHEKQRVPLSADARDRRLFFGYFEFYIYM